MVSSGLTSKVDQLVRQVPALGSSYRTMYL
jgi:hypothetical protein